MSPWKSRTKKMKKRTEKPIDKKHRSNRERESR